MSKKEVYAVLELSDHEVKLLVCEFLEGRLNVLHKERQNTNGIVNSVIVNKNDVVANIIKVAAKTQEVLGFDINRVLLSLPSVNVKNVTKRVNVFIDSTERKITIDYIKKGVSELLNVSEDDTIPVNIGSVRYITNGIISRKMPLYETSDVLVVSADVLYADKDIVFNYVGIVEEAGLEVMDICLAVFAAAEETSIVRKMDTKYVVGINLEKTTTTLTLFEKDKILSSQIVPYGYGRWITKLKEVHDLPADTLLRLIKSNIPFDKNKVDDLQVFVYGKDQEQIVLTKREVYELLEEPLNEWCSYIIEVCGGIINSGETKFVIYGEGSDFDGLKDLLPKFPATTTNYIPDIFGARYSAFTSMLGMFYVWNEQRSLKNDYRNCSDSLELERNEVSKKKIDIGLTQRLKRALMLDK